MENNNTQQVPAKRRWYQKKRYIIPIISVAWISALASVSSTSSPISDTPSPTVQAVQQAAPSTSDVKTDSAQQTQPVTVPNKSAPAPVQQNTAQSDELSNNNYYTNSDDQAVHSPAYSEKGGAQAGATAQCNDGTYSFSTHHQGTCSYHDGVAEWY